MPGRWRLRATVRQPGSGRNRCEVVVVLPRQCGEGDVDGLMPVMLRGQILQRVGFASEGSVVRDFAVADNTDSNCAGFVMTPTEVAFLMAGDRNSCWRSMRERSLPSPTCLRARTNAVPARRGPCGYRLSGPASRPCRGRPSSSRHQHRQRINDVREASEVDHDIVIDGGPLRPSTARTVHPGPP